MTDLVSTIGFYVLSAALMLSVIGLWFAAVMPGFDRWSRRFFLAYFTVWLLCCLSCLAEIILSDPSVSNAALYFVVTLESLLFSLPLPMLTVCLLHCCEEDMRRSRLLRIVLGLWAAHCAILADAFSLGGYSFFTPGKSYFFGPEYPLPLLPLFLILLLNLAGAIHRRKRLSHKAFLAFLVAILPMTGTMLAHLFIDASLILGISCVLSALAMFSLILSDQIERYLHNQQEIARQQMEIANERVNVMALQLRPHFIYNSLMCIYSLCNHDPQKARQVTLDFTNYLRRNFNAVVSGDPIPFSAELEHTRAYLAVEQADFEELLLVEYDTPFTHFRLPPLTLQPIVENAVKHGMSPYSGPLCISIRTRHTDSGTEITVEDNGPGFDPSDESRPHIALKNIQQRLEMMCQGKMTIMPREGGGTVVKVILP